MRYLKIIRERILSVLLVSVLVFTLIGSTFQNVDALAGDNNKTLVIENLIDNGDFSDGSTGWSLLNTSVINEEVIFDVGIGDSGSISQNPIIAVDDVFYLSYNVTDYTNGALYLYRPVLNSSILYDVGVHSYIFVATNSNDFKISRLENTIEHDYILDDIMMINLTELFGAGNEPTLEEFELILADAPDYFDEWNYNYYEADSSIVEFDCQRTAINLVDNGDFETNTDWVYIGLSNYDINSGNLFNINSDFSGIQQIDINFNLLHKYYLNFVTIDYISGSGTTNIISIDINDNGNYSILSFPSLPEETFYFKRQTSPVDLNIDNVMLFDLTTMYGQNNEPSLAEWEIILNANLVDGYTDGFTYDGTCYMTVEQDSPIYMYDTATLELSMTDTIKDLPLTNPKISIEKYDLNMNYEGNIYEGYITDNTLTDGYYTHSISYILPEPVTSEDGYIYVAYDTKDNNIIASGYVFQETSQAFDLENDADNAIGVNGSPYFNEPHIFLFDGDYENYLFNDSNYLITHLRVDENYILTADINYYNENTNQVVNIDIIDVYDQFCNVGYDYVSIVPLDYYDCYFYSSSGDFLPPLLVFLQSSAIAHNSYLTESLAVYVSDYTNFFYDPLFADNKGVYTYKLAVGASSYLGETPIYHLDNFHNMELASHSVKEGGVLRVDLDKPEIYLDEVYTYQYLYDNNTAVYYFEVTDEIEQVIYLETFLGLTPDNATVYYHMKALDVYTNGAPADAYDIYDSDIYEMRAIVPFSDKIDNGLDMFGLNDTFGKIAFSGILLIFTTVLGFIFAKKNVVVVLIIDFLMISLLTVLGIIPTWIMLFILILILGTFYIVLKKRGE